MPLTDAAIRTAKPRERAYKLTDGEGMYLEVMPNGSRYWRLKYRFHGKEKRAAIGVYPAVSLLAAREARHKLKEMLRAGDDPADVKRQTRLKTSLKRSNSFETVAREWHNTKIETWKPRYADGVMKLLETGLFSSIGARPVAEITAPELLEVLRKIESRGALEMSRKTMQIAGQVFRFGVATGRAERDPTADLKGALKTRKVRHMARISETELPELMRKIAAYDGELQTRLALRFLALTFVRTGELRYAEWTEIDESRAQWRIPAERMKMESPHIVPLSTQALEVIRQLRELNGRWKWVFPQQINTTKPMSENTILFALYRLGYHSRMTGHGFRGLASTILNEHGFSSDWIERQLAHIERDDVRAAYNHAQYLDERRKMMQWWADHISEAGRSDEAGNS
ncbi:MAG: integrase arm-type DNA-binding domain-containing protein [Paraburkholderia sp.]|uniref:tyrosine-type recombinase/integrase n=1 Tax=Paraburkholderia sp. TaxID=1926495 RepID=UPI003C5A5B06